MRNYVIINGVNSLTIQGLAIKTLPPITKPIQRNLREEIDGRDGDIVTTLGYGAYDKTIEIGLFGTFDIDEVIAYFNQKGTITFSNEADKVYYFEALDQVDYAELLKFRTANVVLHCQPFKYPINETPLVEEYEYVEATGTNLTLDNTSEAIFNKIDLLGNTSQTGTPTPTSPIPVNVVSGDNYINICGKNLANPSNIYLGKSINGNDGTLFNLNTRTTLYQIPINPNSSYNANLSSNYYVGNMVYYKKDKSFLETQSSSWASTKSLTTPSNAYYVSFAMKRTDDGAMTQSDIENLKLQLEKGTATTYEPYIGNTYPISLGDIELCKIGTYQDYIYKDNGSWYLHKEIGKVVLDGSESWTTRGGATSYAYGLVNVFDGNKTNGISNYFRFIQGGATNSQNIECVASANTDTRLSVFTNNSSLDTLENFKTWLASNNLIVYYILATPTDTLIEDTTLIEQLEALKLATSYKGQTNISQTNNDMPFVLDLSALKENSDHLVIDNIGNIYSKPTLDLEGTGIVDIYLNDTQMFEVDLSEKNEIVIDTEKMEAYNPTDNTLANRQVTGDYSKFKLESGENDLRFSGDLTKATITRYERWL